ncbi:hypothetical protein [Rheinheimera sp.]|uniref:hypothetical protein n=2 Tax=Rheinheimera sp. TaxID=1869214 RepID=UPI004047C773
MGVMICKKHGEVGVIPTVSKNLADAMLKGIAIREDVATIYLRVFDEGEFLFDKLFFTHNSQDMSNLKDEYVIENETDDAVFSREVHPIFSGGGYCVRCFKEYMDNIGFDLTNLPSSSGLTN